MKMRNSERCIFNWLYILVTVSVVYGRYTSRKSFAIYINGVIYTVDPYDDEWNLHPEEAIVVNDHTGYIEYIGDNAGALQYHTEFSYVHDLRGNTVLPGFHDVHMHPLEAMTELGGGCSVPSNTPPENMLYNISQCKTRNDATAWVLGHGHSIEYILEHIDNGGRPPKEIIDEVMDTNPVIIMEETSHSVWVNSKALELAGITKDTPNNPGGIIMKDANTGEPNGILFENAGNEIMDLAMKSFKNLDEMNYDALLLGLEELRMNGITSVCDARTYWKRNHHDAWKMACDDKELTVRAVLGLWAYPHMNDAEQIQRLKELYTNGYNKMNAF